MTQHRSWSATFIPNFDVLYAYLACIQPIFARDSASRGVSLHREGGREGGMHAHEDEWLGSEFE